MPRSQSLSSWMGPFLAGQDTGQVRSIPAQLIAPLRQYLLHLRTKKRRTDRTLEMHAYTLIDFFTWLSNGRPAVELSQLRPDHTTLYLSEYQVDGRVQGRQTKRPGHKKSTRTMSTKAGILRAFFSWAKNTGVCSTNPLDDLSIEWGMRDVHPLSEEQVAHLVGEWLKSDAHPRTAVTGLLCLVFGLATGDLLRLPVDAVDLNDMTFHGLKTPAPIPSWLRPPLVRYAEWRTTILGNREDDRYLLTRATHGGPINRCLFSQILKPYGVTIRQLRATALAQTIFHGHLKLLTVFGMTNEGMRRYQAIARLTQNTRKVTPKPNLW